MSMGAPQSRLWQEDFYARVQKSDYCWVWVGSLDTKGYGRFHVAGKSPKAHRLSWSWANYCPMPPSKLLIDHKCHNPACVNPEHLRLVTYKQNAENKKGLFTNNKSGVHGVSWCNSKMRWRAQVRHNGVRYHAGYHLIKEDAAKSVILKRNELFTHNDKDRT